MAGHAAKLDPVAYRAFLKRKREEVEKWPEWKKQAAEASFAPKLLASERSRLEPTESTTG